MREFVSSKVAAIKPSGIRKFFDIAAQLENVISLSVGEPDFDTPYEIRKEAIESLKDGKTFYTSNSGLLALRQKICAYYQRKYHCNYKVEETLVTAGSSEAIDICFRAIIEPGDEIIVLAPNYVSYEPCVLLAGGTLKVINLKEENGFQLTKEELEKNITPKTKAILMNYPNNPTGAVISKENLVAISKVCIEHNILVISDEIYSELVYDTKYTSIASLEGMKDLTVIINGFSKAYAMTGWRLGYVLGPVSIIKAMTKIHQFVIMCAPTMAQYGALRALDEDIDEEVEKMRLEYDKRRNYLVKRLKDLGLDCFEPKGAFYIFPSIKKFGLSSEEFCLKLLNEENVAIVPGSAFGEAGEGFVRISYAYSLESLQVALDKIAKFINKIKS